MLSAVPDTDGTKVHELSDDEDDCNSTPTMKKPSGKVCGFPYPCKKRTRTQP